MNLLKKFVRNDPADVEEEGEYDDFYAIPEELKMEMETEDPEVKVSALDSPARKTPEIHPVAEDKVTLKLLKPKSHTEATAIADKLKEGCIVLLDICNLTKEQSHRLIDFLAGVAYVLGGEMIKTNKNTIIVAPSGVDISSFAADEPEEAPATDAAATEEYEEEIYEEIPATEEA